MIMADGRKVRALKAAVERRYKDKDGTWKSSGSFGRTEIPLVIYCLQKAFDHTIKHGHECILAAGECSSHNCLARQATRRVSFRPWEESYLVLDFEMGSLKGFRSPAPAPRTRTTSRSAIGYIADWKRPPGRVLDSDTRIVNEEP